MNPPVLPLFSPLDLREVPDDFLPRSLPFRFTPDWVMFRVQSKVYVHVWTRSERVFVAHLIKQMPKKRKNAKRDS